MVVLVVAAEGYRRECSTNRGRGFAEDAVGERKVRIFSCERQEIDRTEAPALG
jgi:hypothetical protein